MAISKVIQSQATLVNALSSILTHTGPTGEVLSSLDNVTGLLVREVNRAANAGPFLAFASGSTGAANLGAAGAFGVANGGVAAVQGSTFVLNGTTDSSDTVLAT